MQCYKQAQGQNALTLTKKTSTSERLKDECMRLYLIGYQHEKRIAQFTYD